MSQKTEPIGVDSSTELSTQHLVTLVVASAFVLTLVFCGSWLLSNPLAAYHIEATGPMSLLCPWVLAAVQTIANGLTEFSGSSLEPVGNSIFIASFLSILFIGILTPTLTFLLVGKQRSATARGLHLVCLIITVTFALTVLPTGYMAYRVRMSLREAQAVQTNKDHIINEICAIAWKTREYQIVPKVLGGGEGTLDGYTLPAPLAETENATYVLRRTSRDADARTDPRAATIHASSRKYPGSEVEVTMWANGQLRSWEYTGQFQ
jgi:hypothetical protein